MVAKSIPILGTALAAGFSVGRLLAGDVTGAALEAASGLGGAATAIPATVALVAKDVYQEAYGVSPEKDPEAKEKLKTITEQIAQAVDDFFYDYFEKGNKEKADKLNAQLPTDLGKKIVDQESAQLKAGKRMSGGDEATKGKAAYQIKQYIEKEEKKGTSQEQLQVVKDYAQKKLGKDIFETKEETPQSIIAAREKKAAKEAASGTPPIVPTPVKEAVEAKPEANTEAPAVVPTPVKEAVEAKPKSGSEALTERLNKQKQKEQEWVGKGYKHLNDIPKEELEAYTKDFATKSLSPAYAKSALHKRLSLKLRVQGAKAETGSNDNVVERNIETGEVKTTAQVTPQKSEQPSPHAKISAQVTPQKSEQNDPKVNITAQNSNSESILRQIATNTGSSNDNIRGLIGGFNELAKALEKTLGKEARVSPVIVNNTQNNNTNQSLKPSPSMLANVGNEEISLFRSSQIEGHRFAPV